MNVNPAPETHTLKNNQSEMFDEHRACLVDEVL